MGLSDAAAGRAADLIAASRLARHRLDALPEALRPQDEDEAYRVQGLVHERLAAGGAGSIAGAKIGCTTPVMQAYLGIDNPCAGALFLATVHQQAGTAATSPGLRLGVECEIAVRLGADLPRRPRGYAAADVADAVTACLCAIEVVEDRYVDYPSLDTPTLIADDFFNAGAVLGVPHDGFDARDLGRVTARMLINGAEVGSGVGTDVMGDPLAALAWLATSASARGAPLAAGAVVLLGSLVQTVWIAAGDAVVIENDRLGGARLDVAPGRERDR